MWFRRGRTTKKKALDPRRKILLWATLIASICGAIEFGEPLEDFLRIVRNEWRKHPASGDIVVVGIDDRTIQALGAEPIPRRHLASIVDRLREQGVRRIFFDISFRGSSNSVDDRIFADALASANGQVFIATTFNKDRLVNKSTHLPPARMFSRHAKLVNIDAWRNYANQVWKVPYGTQVDGDYVPSMSSKLANLTSQSVDSYQIDYALDLASITQVSGIDVIDRIVPTDKIAGKDVIVAPTAQFHSDKYMAPGHGPVAGVFGHVMGAETLKKGVPVRISWLLPLALSLGIVFASLFVMRRAQSIAVWAGSVVAVLTVPASLESRLIFVDIVPALLILLIVGSGRAWMLVRQKGATTNLISGLPNLNALRQTEKRTESALVVARIQNFAEITSSLHHELERTLVDQISNRFALGIGGATLYQGDEGIFAWLAGPQTSYGLGDQIEGLHALLSTPVIIGERHIDLAVSFGVESGNDRSLTNRIGSALVAADQAAAQGAKWKGFDLASLKDAEWKLSLLGRLDIAIDTGEIWVAYQPKLEISTNRVVGAEALVRWSHPEKGEISPEQFVLVAEQHGRIERLTLHVLERAIQTAAAINAGGVDFGVAVNLSARLLDNPYLAHMIEVMLHDNDLPPHRLTLEVTESAAMTGASESIVLLDSLRKIGIGVSIDDYGTGFSTLEYLRRIPATEIKIDKSFVSLIERSNSDRLMVNSTIQLAHELGRKVVAEGVETSATLRSLGAMGCDIAQGYLIGRPMKLPALTELVLGERSELAA